MGRVCERGSAGVDNVWRVTLLQCGYEESLPLGMNVVFTHRNSQFPRFTPLHSTPRRNESGSGWILH